MSWIDRIKNTVLEVTTGDGVTYKPLWTTGMEKLKDFNVATFEFHGITGTLVHRGTAKGKRYTVELVFQGADHLVHADDFDKSSNDSRPWRITHPYYGQLYVQPVSLRFDNRAYNVTKITVQIIETIGASQLRITVDPVATISTMKFTTDAVGQEMYLSSVPLPKTPDAIRMHRSLGDIFNSVSGSIKNAADQEAYFNAFNTADAFVGSMLDGPEAMISAVASMQALIVAPIRFEDSVINRVGMLVRSFEKLVKGTVNLTLWSLKKQFELLGGTVISSIALAASLPLPDDYRNRTQVLDMVETLLDNYNTFLVTLDGLQTDTNATLNSYVPNPDLMVSLEGLVNYTIGNLFEIANSARQERVSQLTEDTNPVSLTYALYGLKKDDSTLNQLIDDNKIMGEELFVLRKGREIVYYV